MTTTPPGLRERKKAKTRWAIQEHALRLFAEQGYDATTVDQIAAAAEISPSTFFRYFPTKEDVVVQDAYDDLIVEAFRQAGASADPVGTLRSVLATAVTSMPETEWAKGRARMDLTLSVPALRARSVDNFVTVSRKVIEVFAKNAGRPADDVAVCAIVGACLGVLASVAMASPVLVSSSLAEVVERMDAGLSLLAGVQWFPRDT
jgi:AcrR family transcriptional regulator